MRAAPSSPSRSHPRRRIRAPSPGARVRCGFRGTRAASAPRPSTPPARSIRFSASSRAAAIQFSAAGDRWAERATFRSRLGSTRWTSCCRGSPTTAARPRCRGARRCLRPAPLVEGAVGILRRSALGAPRARRPCLGAARSRPRVFDDFRVDESARQIGTVALGLGFGARVGILRETGPLPGISVSIMRRDLPTITYGDVAAGDEFQYAVSLRATNLRLVASKQFALADVAAGLGWDRYTGKALDSGPERPRIRRAGRPSHVESERASPMPDSGLGPATLVAEARLPGRQGPACHHRFRRHRHHAGEVLRGSRPARGLVSGGDGAGGDGARARARVAWLGSGAAQPAGGRGRAARRASQSARAGTPSSAAGTRSRRRSRPPATRARGATVVCTLEPCAHQGKQPPCTEAHPRRGSPARRRGGGRSQSRGGGGAARLRAAGVEVELGLLADQAAAQNAIFLHRQRDPSRPFVALKLATIDRRPHRRRQRALALALGRPRPASSCIGCARGSTRSAVGGVTARADDPSLTVRGPRAAARAAAPRRVRRRRRRAGVARAGSHGAARLPTSRSSRRGSPAARLAPLEAAGVDVIRAAASGRGDRRSAPRASDSILVEGGGRLAGALLSAGLVDRYYWIQTPLWLGAGGAGGRGASDDAAGRRAALAGHGAPPARRGHAARAGPALMFTGIVTAVGRVRRRRHRRAGSS